MRVHRFKGIFSMQIFNTNRLLLPLCDDEAHKVAISYIIVNKSFNFSSLNKKYAAHLKKNVYNMTLLLAGYVRKKFFFFLIICYSFYFILFFGCWNLWNRLIIFDDDAIVNQNQIISSLWKIGVSYTPTKGFIIIYLHIIHRF